jgi:hypothetical protein
MSLDIAMALRDEARKVRGVAEVTTDPDSRRALVQVAARLVQIAERFEQDARD